jgi:hypothetical protein
MKDFYAALAAMTLICFQANAQTEPGRNYEWKQCNEDVLGLRVDPVPLRSVLGADFKPVLEAGKAQVAIMVQDCSQYWIDGENLGPNQMVHILVRIEGSPNVESVVGAQRTEQTFTWFSVFAGSNNPLDQKARMASRTSPSAIETVSLEPPEWPRGGSVKLDADLRISWKITSAERSALLMGVNHDVYLRDDADNTVLKRIQAIGNLVAAPSPGVLQVEGDSNLALLIGKGTQPVRVYSFFPIWARGVLGEVITE